MMAIARCTMERCDVVESNSIDVGMSIKKELDALMIAIARCIMERCILDAISSIDVGMSIKKELDALMMATGRCPMEWCEGVGINSIDVGIAIKKRSNVVQPALFSSLKERLIKISLRSHDRDDPQRLNEKEYLHERTEAERRSSSSESERGERAMRLRCCVADRRKETDKANPLLLLMLASLLSKPSIALSILPTTSREGEGGLDDIDPRALEMLVS